MSFHISPIPGSVANHLNDIASLTTIQLSSNPLGLNPVPYFSLMANDFQNPSDAIRTYSFSKISIPNKPTPPSLPFIDPPTFPKEMTAIPPELHEDAFFQENIDPLTYEPLFNPVADRNEPKHVYERESILRWVRSHSTSPLTRETLTEKDLIPVTELKKEIDKRLNEHFLKQHPELVSAYEEKVKKATIQYQEALRHYHEVALPEYENRWHQNVHRQKKIDQLVQRNLVSYFLYR